MAIACDKELDQGRTPAGADAEAVDCPVCGPGATSPFTVSNGLQIVRCRGCGLLYVNPRAGAGSIATHFREEYIKDAERVTVDFISYREESLSREAAIIRRLFPDGGRLLDVGAASGAFLRMFAGDPSWRAEGVEPSAYAARYAREELGLDVHEGFLGEQGFRDNTFDVVASLDTFMFHPEPGPDLEEMNRVLKPGGVLAIEIPGLWFRLKKNTGPICRLIYGVPARLNARVHQFFYSRRTLKLLCARYGFKLVGAYPERSPSYGPMPFRALTALYFRLTGALYRASGGRLNAAPKEFLIFRKVNA